MAEVSSAGQIRILCLSRGMVVVLNALENQELRNLSKHTELTDQRCLRLLKNISTVDDLLNKAIYDKIVQHYKN